VPLCVVAAATGCVLDVLVQDPQQKVRPSAIYRLCRCSPALRRRACLAAGRFPAAAALA
jgi:hypothetical protein